MFTLFRVQIRSKPGAKVENFIRAAQHSVSQKLYCVNMVRVGLEFPPPSAIVESHIFGFPKLAARASKSAKGVGCFGDLKLNAMIEDRTVAEWARSVWSVDDVTAVTFM